MTDFPTIAARSAAVAEIASKAKGLVYLCYGWGESDHPICRIAMTIEEVAQFLCDEWFGEQPETMHPENREEFDAAMARVKADRDDPDSWDGTDEIEWQFEIGGVRITRAHQSGLAASHQLASDNVALVEMVMGLQAVLIEAQSFLLDRFGHASAPHDARASHVLTQITASLSHDTGNERGGE